MWCVVASHLVIAAMSEPKNASSKAVFWIHNEKAQLEAAHISCNAEYCNSIESWFKKAWFFCSYKHNVTRINTARTSSCLINTKTELILCICCCSKVEEMGREERRTRIRLGESLQALRPTMSGRGKQPPAIATPTLYDIVRFVGNLSLLGNLSVLHFFSLILTTFL